MRDDRAQQCKMQPGTALAGHGSQSYSISVAATSPHMPSTSSTGDEPGAGCPSFVVTGEAVMLVEGADEVLVLNEGSACEVDCVKHGTVTVEPRKCELVLAGRVPLAPVLVVSEAVHEYTHSHPSDRIPEEWWWWHELIECDMSGVGSW